ncbi:MAG: M2 family metallopeptidase [Bacteroidetes bacterium]|nr:M2 family metallopeptidase [Bacteroidota bacterium]
MSCIQQPDENHLKKFIEQHTTTVEPLMRALNLANWKASATGEQRYYDEQARLELELRLVYANRREFEQLKQWKETGSINDPLLQRQLTILYNSYLPNQIDTTLLRQIVEKSTAIANTFNTFRPLLDGKEVSDNEIDDILRNETNSLKRKKAWEASKLVGRAVAKDVIDLVRLRNKAAQLLGFRNYYQMMLTASEQNEEELFALFDELDRLTEKPFLNEKQTLDRFLAHQYGIEPNELRPWHYHDRFFQEAPRVSTVYLEPFFKGKSIDELARRFYRSIGLPVDDILDRSDLYERKGKYQHAFATDIDRAGDVRIMVNIKDNEYWMSTVLHECGHGVYSKYIDRTLPFLLRTEAHILLTEAIAQLMERQIHSTEWLTVMVNIPHQVSTKLRKESYRQFRLKQLIFSRWSQVMVRFERALYENPDQDLNMLWWNLVKRYQHLTPPEHRNEPDWAAKIHLAQVPVYYHNYLLGELVAAQLHHTIATTVLKTDEVLPSYYGNEDVGTFLRTHVFEYGATHHWNTLLEKATGERLTALYFANDLEKKH